MKVKKIHSATKPHPSNSWGDRNGKLYYGNAGEGFTPALMPESINTTLSYKGEYVLRRNSIPECDEGMAIGMDTFKVFGFGGQKGLRNRPFESKRGSTAGKFFIFVNGGLVSTDGSIGYRQGMATSASDRIVETKSCCEVLFETESYFIIFNRTVPSNNASFGLARLLYVNKLPGSESVQILSGYFDCVYLGQCRTATAGVYRHCIAFMTGLITSKGANTPDQFSTSLISEPATEGPYTVAGLGANLHILTVSDSVHIASHYSWLLQGRKIGSGSLGGNYYWNRGHKYKVTFDESMIFRDSEGYISRFSYVGHIQELGQEIWNSKDSPTTTTRTENLQSTFGICHVDFGPAGAVLPTLSFSHQQITLPQELMEHGWTFNGSNTAITSVGLCLLSGRSWRTDTKFYCLMLDGAYNHTTSNAPGVLVSADVDEYNNISNIQTITIPAKFGLDSYFEVQLLSASKQLVWLPSTTQPYSTLVCVDLRGDTPEISSHKFDTYISALGTRNNELMVTFGLNNYDPALIGLGDQPDVTIGFDAVQYAIGDMATITVSSPADCTCVILLRNCIYSHKNIITAALLAGVEQTFQVRVLGEPSAHLIDVE